MQGYEVFLGFQFEVTEDLENLLWRCESGGTQIAGSILPNLLPFENGPDGDQPDGFSSIRNLFRPEECIEYRHVILL